jgi:hypothetical protein
MLRKLESLACFGAAFSALAIEGAFVYWMRLSPIGPPTAGLTAYATPWIGPTLPQCWLLGGVVALFYYLCRATHPDAGKAADGRRTFLGIWYWFIALASAQGCALGLNYLQLVRR